MPERPSEGRTRKHQVEEREGHRLRREQNNSLPDRPAHSRLPPREEPRISLQPTHSKMPPLLHRQRTSRIRLRLAERENRPTGHNISDNLSGCSEIGFQTGSSRRRLERGPACDRLERQAGGGRSRTEDENTGQLAPNVRKTIPELLELRDLPNRRNAVELRLGSRPGERGQSKK